MAADGRGGQPKRRGDLARRDRALLHEHAGHRDARATITGGREAFGGRLLGAFHNTSVSYFRRRDKPGPRL